MSNSGTSAEIFFDGHYYVEDVAAARIMARPFKFASRHLWEEAFKAEQGRGDR
jgi:hypothetical protein